MDRSTSVFTAGLVGREKVVGEEPVEDAEVTFLGCDVARVVASVGMGYVNHGTYHGANQYF